MRKKIKRRMKRRIKNVKVYSLLLALLFGLTSCSMPEEELEYIEQVVVGQMPAEEMSIKEASGENVLVGKADIALTDIPAFSGNPYIVIDGNIPDFQEDESTTQSFEIYSDLDALGRCGVAYANIGTDIMPTGERENIGQVKPTGWQSTKYDSIEGKYLYNRCHLIGYQLTGENANKKNLITGTRYMNVSGMLPFENMVADYVQETEYHVLYRVTPIYEGNNLVASGVQMEGWSVEDKGEGICFNVYVYNHQPGIVIDYATGESQIAEDNNHLYASDGEMQKTTYILNINTKKFHTSDCESAERIKSEHKQVIQSDREALIAEGYKACGICKP